MGNSFRPRQDIFVATKILRARRPDSRVTYDLSLGTYGSRGQIDRELGTVADGALHAHLPAV
jgi:hypothetical protein